VSQTVERSPITNTGSLAAGVHILAGADLSLHDRALDRREDGGIGIDAGLFLKGRYRLVGQAENSQFVARRTPAPFCDERKVRSAPWIRAAWVC